MSDLGGPWEERPRSTPLGSAPPPGSAPAPGYPSPPPPGSPPPPPGYGAPPPGFGRPPIAQPQWAGPPLSPGTNGMAIAAFVLGLLWVLCIGSVLGIVFGFVALSQIRRTGQSGRGLAIAGIVLGILGLAASIAIAVWVADEAEDVLDEDPRERDDVTLVGCNGGAGDATAQLEITNDSSRTSSYFITIRFRDGTDSVVQTDGFDGVDPGETVTAEISAGQRLDSDVRCTINYVNRLATGSTEGDE